MRIGIGSGGWYVLLLTGALLLPGCGAPAAPQTSAPPAAQPPNDAARSVPLTPLRVGYSAASGTWAPLFVAAEAGLFEKYGLAIELVPLFGTQGPQAMVAGNVPLMALGGTSAAPSMVEGADLVMVLAAINRMTLQIYGVSTVESPQALKGKRLAITRPGTLTYFGGRLALRELGLKPDEDVAIVSLNDSAGVLAGVLGGAADAGVLTDPFTLLARKQGLHLLVDLAYSPTEYLVAGVTTTHAYVKNDRPTLLSFLKGWMEGTKRYWDDRELAIAALSKYTEIDDREVLAESYDLYANYFARDPTPGAQSMQNILTDYADANPKAREVDPARTVDPSLIEDLRREGFLRSLGLE